MRSTVDSPLVDDSQRRAIDRALRWLASKQQRGGMWGQQDNSRVADTALAVLALMAGGNTVLGGTPLEVGEDSTVYGPVSTRGPYGSHVKRGLEYLARLAWTEEGARTSAAGYIQDDQVSNMHGHGFALLTLAQACGNLGGGTLRDVRRRVSGGQSAAQLSLPEQVRYGVWRAVRCTERAQDTDTGGWGYEPYPGAHEGSMTVTQIEALRAAHDAGVSVDGAVMKRAYQYLRDSQNTARGGGAYGGFAYQKDRKTRVSYALTAAALTTLFGLGRYGLDPDDEKMIQRGFQYMDSNLNDALKRRQWFYYGLFYGTQALYLADDQRRLRTQWPRMRAALLSRQLDDGEFENVERERSKEYCTAIACLTLQVPLETLPIFQRH